MAPLSPMASEEPMLSFEAIPSDEPMLSFEAVVSEPGAIAEPPAAPDIDRSLP